MTTRSNYRLNDRVRNPGLTEVGDDPLVPPAVYRSTVFCVESGEALIAEIAVGDHLLDDLTDDRRLYAVAL
jgi:hypothetical protein